MSNWLELTSPGIAGLKPYVPGKPMEELERELGLKNTLKLASNENPLGPSPLGVAASQQALAQINLYPDDSGYRLRHKLAVQFNVDPEGLTFGNGSSDVIDMVARVLLSPGVNAVFSQYSFAMYPIFTQASGAQAKVAPALPADDPDMPYGHDLQAMLALIDDHTRVVFIANPNNPTGTWLDKEALETFLAKVRGNVVVVLDEAYTEYVENDGFANGISWLQQYPNLIVTRTFSKIYGLAGLRIGFGMSSPELAQVIQRVRHPFNANLIALAGAEGALDDDAFLQQSRQINRQGLLQLDSAFRLRGLRTIPSVANFITVDLGREAAPVNQALLQQGVIVRPVANYGMPDHLRITIGTEEQNDRFLQALDKALA